MSTVSPFSAGVAAESVSESLIDIPGAKSSEVISTFYGADLGVTRALVNDNPAGLAIVIPPTDAWPGDEFEVFFSNKDAPVLSFVVPDDYDGASAFDRSIDARQVPEGFSELFYRLNGAESDHLKVLVRTKLPGGVDPKPAFPGHHLLLAPQVDATKIDGSQDIVATVLPWPGMRVGQLLHLQFGNSCLPHTVEKNEVGHGVDFTLTQEMIEQIGPCNILLFYKLWDEVGNAASDHSMACTLTCSPPTSAMGADTAWQAPRILGLDQDNAIDLVVMEGGDITVEIDVAANGLAQGSQVQLNWWGEPAVAAPQLSTWTQTVGTASTLVFAIDRAEAQRLVGGWASVTWQLVQENDFPLTSPAAECFFIDSSLADINAADNSVLQIDIPYAPESKMPVPGSSVMCGISKLIYDDKPDGLWITLDPWPGKEAFESAMLILNGEDAPVDSQEVQPGTEADRISFRVPHLRLNDGINMLECCVRRISGNEEYSWRPLTMLYHAVRPGIEDQDDSVEGHSELTLEFPIAENNGIDVVREGLNSNLQQLTLHLRYPFRRRDDHVDIRFGTYIFHYTVLPSQAPSDLFDKTTPLVVVIPAAELDQIPRGRNVPVEFMVTDRVDNTTTPQQPWSAPKLINVDRNDEDLPELIFSEDPNDNNDNPEEIDLQKLAGGELTLVIMTNHRSYKAGDLVRATFRGPSNPDYPVPVGTVEAQFGQTIPLFLKVPNNLLIPGEEVHADYETEFRSIGQQNYSRKSYATVVGVALPDLAPPWVVDAPGGVLLPIRNQSGATAWVEVSGFLPGDQVQLVVDGASGAGSPVFQPVPLDANGQAQFALLPAFIVANMDMTVDISYVLIRGAAQKTSPTLILTVRPIDNEDTALPTPLIDRYPGATLDPWALPTDNTIRTRIARWPYIELTRYLWLDYFGVNADGTPYRESTYTQTPMPADGIPAGMLPFTPVANLRNLQDKSELKIEFRISFDPATPKDRAVLFPIKTYTLDMQSKDLPIPTLTEATAPGTGPIVDLVPERVETVGGSVVVSYTSMTPQDRIVLTVRGRAGLGSPTIAAKDGETDKSVLFTLLNTAFAANFDRQMVMFYTVTRNGVALPPSGSLTVNVGRPVLPMPYIEGAAGDILNVSTLAGTERTVVVKWPFQRSGLFIHLKYTGTKADGTYTELVVWRGSAHNYTDGMYYAAPYAWLRALKNGTPVSIIFMASFTGVNTVADATPFPVRTYTVKTAPTNLQLPNLVEATGTGAAQTLAPSNVDPVNGVTVRIVVTGLEPTDSIKLTLTGRPGAGTPNLPAVPGEADGSVDIRVPASAIAANVGNGVIATFTLSYVVTRGSETFPSGTVTVTVTPISSSSLISPIFFINNVEVLGNVDLNTFTGNTYIRGKTWTFMAVNQYVKLSLHGKRPDSTDIELAIWFRSQDRVNASWVTNGYWPVGVLRSFLDECGHDTQLVVKFSVSMDLRNDPSTLIDFPDRVYTVKTVSVAPTITSVKAGTTEIPPDGTTDQTSLAIFGTASAGHTLNIYDGETLLGPVTAATDRTWTLPAREFTRERHIITARTTDGRRSAERIFTVQAAEQAPTITAVLDGTTVIAPEEGTYQNRLTVTGTVTPGRPVEIYDENTRLGAGTVSGGNWTFGPYTFGLGIHLLTARTLDGTKRSAQRVFRVWQASQTPTITAVNTAGGGVADRGQTYYRTITSITGTGSPGSHEIRDNGGVIAKVTVPANGTTWSLPSQKFTVGQHSITARAPDGKTSPARVFSVLDGLADHLSKFEVQNYYGWITGPAPGTWRFEKHDGQSWYVLHNHTDVMGTNGRIMYLQLNTLTPGATYNIGSNMYRSNTGGVHPSIRLETSAGHKSITYTLSAIHTGVDMSLYFVPTTPSVTLYVVNDQSSGVGNDWDIRFIRCLRTALP